MDFDGKMQEFVTGISHHKVKDYGMEKFASSTNFMRLAKGSNNNSQNFCE